VNYKELDIVNVDCPACGCEQGSLLYSVSTEMAAQHFVLREQDFERFTKLAGGIRGLWKANQASVLICNECGLGYSFPYVAGDAQFYDLAYKRSRYPRDKWEHHISVDKLLSGIKMNSEYQLLEIGAGDGQFVRLISPRALSPSQITCTEFSDYGASQLSAQGIKCYQDDIRKIGPKLKNRFNAICLFQVFEHLDGNRKLLELFHDLGAEGADLIITVPNPKWTEFIETNGALLDMPPNHIARWGAEQIKILGKDTGWELMEHQIEPATWLAQAKRFSIFKYLRKSQRHGTLANKIESTNLPLKKLFKAVGVAYYALFSLKNLWQLRDPELGCSLWLHLRKS